MIVWIGIIDGVLVRVEMEWEERIEEVNIRGCQ